MRHPMPIALTLLLLTLVSACQSSAPPKPDGKETASKDTAFTTIAGEYLEDIYRRPPTQATDLGVHKYDDQLENYSQQAVHQGVAAAKQFRDRVSAIEPGTLSADKQLDREQ